jgi:hypothetical protein
MYFTGLFLKNVKEIIENADHLAKKVQLNSVLLEKLKTELISHKMKFAEHQMTLADVNFSKFIREKFTREK